MAVDRPAGVVSASSRGSIWGNETFRNIVYQLLVAAVVAGGVWYLVNNTMENLARRNIATGFDFLQQQAGFGIGESLVTYSATDTYGYAIIVGILNTFKVAVVGIALATLLGTIVGIARLSTNWLIRKLASIYVETFRNIPLLLQLYFWYQVITEVMPPVREAVEPVPGVFLSNRGLRLPAPIFEPAHWYVFIALAIGIIATIFYGAWASARQAKTGQRPSVLLPALALILGLPAVVYFIVGVPVLFTIPELGRFSFAGGMHVTPEFTALTFGLVVYTASFIAEIVRSGILAVSKGQTEAALALGLRPGRVMRLVVLPQALRVIVPPVTSQYLNLVKNSSLAIAIGYPDIVSIVNTTLNQTGQAVEGVAIIMAVYLTFSLSISLFMNWYNRRIALVER